MGKCGSDWNLFGPKIPVRLMHWKGWVWAAEQKTERNSNRIPDGVSPAVNAH